MPSSRSAMPQNAHTKDPNFVVPAFATSPMDLLIPVQLFQFCRLESTLKSTARERWYRDQCIHNRRLLAFRDMRELKKESKKENLVKL